MSITLELPGELVSDLKELTSQQDCEAAVEEAVAEFIRMKRLQELKSASGKIEFSDSWKEMDEAEFDDNSQ